MKHLIYSILIASIFSTINYYFITKSKPNSTSDFKIVVIDRCEYIYNATDSNKHLVHKGNCRNHK